MNQTHSDGARESQDDAHSLPEIPLVALAPARWAARWSIAKRVLQVGIPLVIVWLVWHELKALDLHQVREILGHANATLIILGIAASFGSVISAGLYDALAFPDGKHGLLGFGRRWMFGSVIYGWTDFITMGPFGGPAIRILVYRRSGLTGPEITRGIFGQYLSSSTGLVSWLVAAWIPIGSGPAITILRIIIALVGALLLPKIVTKIVLPILKRHRYGTELDGLPLIRLAMAAFAQWGLVFLAFSLLIRAVGVEIDPTSMARTVFTGEFAGLTSMIPGGLGSADAVWFHGFSLLGVSHANAGAAIIAFRGGFYLLPWTTSLIMIYITLAMRFERLWHWQRRLIAGAVMVNAIVLLISAATPPLRSRLDAVADLVPLGAIEVSQGVATGAAALMLLLVHGLLRGYRSAYLLTLCMLAASIIAHPIKGGDFEEAISSGVLLILMLGFGRAFVRRGRIPVGWEVLFAFGFGAFSLYLITGFAAFEKIPYRQDLWITFAEHAQASRFLRAGVLFALILLLAMVRQATRPAREWITPTEQDIERAEGFIHQYATSAEPLLVGAKDKGVWFFEPTPGDLRGVALIQRKGDRLFVFKDPVVATETDSPMLIDALLQYADTLDVDLVFSLVSTQWMGYLHDFGYHFLKMNQEAVVPISNFTLAGKKNAGFRRTMRAMENEGITYEFIEPPIDPEMIDRLGEVSDRWLEFKGGKELQFSACAFSPSYIQRNPVAVARDRDGNIIAFMNVLTTRIGGPCAPDLMRYIPGLVDNVMDFVILETMQHLHEQGYCSLSLGGAPLSDVGVFRGSRFAERLMHLFSTKAERIYNYRGLMHYKTKFHPRWEPRYLAFAHPWEWASVLIANTRLVRARTRQDRRRIARARMGADDGLSDR